MAVIWFCLVRYMRELKTLSKRPEMVGKCLSFYGNRDKDSQTCSTLLSLQSVFPYLAIYISISITGIYLKTAVLENTFRDVG